MKINKRTIYSSIKATEEEVNFCKILLEIAQNLTKELGGMNEKENLYEIVECLINYNGYVNFDEWR